MIVLLKNPYESLRKWGKLRFLAKIVIYLALKQLNNDKKLLEYQLSNIIPNQINKNNYFKEKPDDVKETLNEVKEKLLELKEKHNEVKEKQNEVKEKQNEVKDARNEVKDIRNEVKEINRKIITPNFLNSDNIEIRLLDNPIRLKLTSPKSISNGIQTRRQDLLSTPTINRMIRTPVKPHKE